MLQMRSKLKDFLEDICKIYIFILFLFRKPGLHRPLLPLESAVECVEMIRLEASELHFPLWMFGTGGVLPGQLSDDPVFSDENVSVYIL